MSKSLFATLLVGAAVGLACVQAGAADPPTLPDTTKLQAALGGAKPDSIAETAMPGLYEVTVGTQVLYVSSDGRFAMEGDLIDLNSARNLSEMRRSQLRLDALNGVGENNMVIFSPKSEAKHTITVFTDIDCGYCRKLHKEISSYTDQGIRVRYMLFPRAGLKSESYDKAVSVWCADNRQDAITRAKLGENIEHRSCANPVSDHYNLGLKLGVRGTPSIILDSGKLVPGYVPAEQLAQMLEGKS
ncbi:MAG: DsbC family protein [Gammaproteobacteria bacterium]